MISVKIKIFGGLLKYTNSRNMIEIKLESEKAISEIIRLINIPDTYVYVVEKNGKIVNKYELVENDCELKLIPFITGG